MNAATIYFLTNPLAWLAFLLWPKFSLTSYSMVNSLSRQGILPKTVIDVGANVGQFAVAAAKLFPNAIVHSFEPQPECVEQLKRNVYSLNNVTVYPLALGNAEGEALFQLNRHSHSSSFLPLAEAHRAAFPNAQEMRKIPVKVTLLDKVLADIDLPSPVMLKLDVQGYEPWVLEGGVKTLERVDYVILEASLKPMYQGERLFEEIITIMREYGFSFLRPIGWLSDPKTGETLQMDALFAKRTNS